MSTGAWSDADVQTESPGQTAALGGTLSEEGRRAAIRAALPVVGRYFQTMGSPGLLRTARAVGTAAAAPDSVDERLIAGLRLRAALSASRSLLEALDGVALRPTFRYSLIQAESIGELAGTLDIARFVARPLIGGGPPSYPIIDVLRSAHTPENILGGYAALWMIQELSESLDGSDATFGSPEAALVRERVERFRAVLARPALSEGRTAAQETLMRGSDEQLIERVEERLRRREVGNPEPYQALLDLVLTLRNNGPTGGAGDGKWSFYDEAFDTRLFELWCLYELAQAISRALAVNPPQLPARWEGGGLTLRWERPAGLLELHYQRSPGNVATDHTSRWLQTDTQKAIRGIPDFIVRAVGSDAGEERLAIVDAKLKQRVGPPTEELYKVLGYFDNFGMDDSPRGAILYHAPQEHDSLTYAYDDAGRRGRLIATALNPSDERQVAEGLAPVAEMILGLLAIPAAPPTKGPTESEEVRVVQQRLTELRAQTAHLSPQTVDASKRRLVAALGDECWQALDNGTRTMLATAEHVGFLLGEDADLSGPVLGLVSAMETVLDARLLKVATRSHPGVLGFQKPQTLGQAINMLTNALDGSSGAASEALRLTFATEAIAPGPLRVTLDALAEVNTSYRIPAAHKEVLSPEHWHNAYRLIITGRALLPELVAVLGR